MLARELGDGKEDRAVPSRARTPPRHEFGGRLGGVPTSLGGSWGWGEESRPRVLARYAPHRRAASKRPLLLGNHDGPKRPASGAASTRGGSPSIRQSARRCRRPELRIPDVAAQTRIVSVAGIRLDHRKSVRPFKGIFCHDISEFESYMPSQAVRSLWAMSRSV